MSSKKEDCVYHEGLGGSNARVVDLVQESGNENQRRAIEKKGDGYPPRPGRPKHWVTRSSSTLTQSVEKELREGMV